MKGVVVWVTGDGWVMGGDTPEPGNGTLQCGADGLVGREINMVSLIAHLISSAQTTWLHITPTPQMIGDKPFHQKVFSREGEKKNLRPTNQTSGQS